MENHCKDCCCAQAWESLGISTYTGRSIPEHIQSLRTGHAQVALAKDDVIEKQAAVIETLQQIVKVQSEQIVLLKKAQA